MTTKLGTPIATTAPIAYAVLCPSCGENIDNAYNGSQMWTREDFDKLNGQTISCTSCGSIAKIRAPRKLV